MSSKYKLTKAEQETIILWDEELDTAMVYTHDRRITNKLASLAKKYPSEFLLTEKSDHNSVTYTVPKRCISIRPPYGEERKERQRLKAARDGLPFSKQNSKGQDNVR